MRRISSSTWLFASLLGLGLIACSGDDQGTATTESSSDGSTSSTSASTTDDSTSGSTSAATSETTSASGTTSTTGPTTDATTTDATTTTDGTTGDPTTTTDSGGGACGDGQVDGGEVCDDGNTKTEFPGNDVVPHSYGDGDCLDACDLVQSTCGNGAMDPGEECDDGNDDPYDGCTPSCTINDGNIHAPCTRSCNGKPCAADDIAAGTIMGCEAVVAPQGSVKACFESGQVVIPNIIDKKLYFAEGECLIAAQKCKGIFCPGYTTFGDYDNFNNCPAGTTLADRVTDQGGVTVSTKVCHKTCESDSDCRWNAHDAFWKKPGQIRCQTTPDTKGVKICTDAQNQG